MYTIGNEEIIVVERFLHSLGNSVHYSYILIYICIMYVGS